MGGKIDAVLKRDDIERSGLPCDNLLLPEVRATHGIFGGEKQAIKKNSAPADESDLSADVDPAQASDVAAKKPHASNSDAELADTANQSVAGDESVQVSKPAENLSLPEDRVPPATLTETDLARIEAEFAAAIPDTIDNFDERMTLSRLKQMASDVRRKAIQEGFRIGEEQGRAQALAIGEADTKTEKDSLASIALALGQALSAEQQQLSVLLSQAVTEIAKVYCGDSLQLNAVFIQSMVDKALSEFAESDSRPTVKLCPADLALLKENDLLSANCDWLEDASLSQGGCLVVGKYSAIDFSLEEQIRQISTELLEGANE